MIKNLILLLCIEIVVIVVALLPVIYTPQSYAEAVALSTQVEIGL